MAVPSLVKVSLAVWLPVLTIGLMYGSIYWYQYNKASHLMQRYNDYASACNAKSYRVNSKGGIYVCQTFDTSIGRGKLGLPVFLEDGVQGDYIPPIN